MAPWLVGSLLQSFCYAIAELALARAGNRHPRLDPTARFDDSPGPIDPTERCAVPSRAVQTPFLLLASPRRASLLLLPTSSSEQLQLPRGPGRSFVREHRAAVLRCPALPPR